MKPTDRIYDIRESTLSSDNEDVRNLMIRFREAHDRLLVDMDNLTEEEYFIRQHEMWGYRNKASELSGDYFLISLWGMSNKADKLYGKGSTARYISFLNNETTHKLKKKIHNRNI